MFNHAYVGALSERESHLVPTIQKAQEIHTDIHQTMHQIQKGKGRSVVEGTGNWSKSKIRISANKSKGQSRKGRVEKTKGKNHTRNTQQKKTAQ